MMKRLLAVLELALVAAMPLMAATETVGGYTWTYRINGDTAEIQSGITPTPTGALTIPSTLGGKTVTSIGSYSFSECSELTNVTIGNSATRIGAYAFCECRRLASVIFKGNALRVGNSAFSYVGSGCTAYVKESSTGWGVEIPGMWNRLNIQYMTPEMEWLVDRGLTADARAANGRTAAECYALGLDPEDATNDFSIVSIEMVDGKPKVEWEPKTNRWTGEEIPTVLKGAERLDGEWHEVDKASESDKAKYRFFKVVVELP